MTCVVTRLPIWGVILLSTCCISLVGFAYADDIDSSTVIIPDSRNGTHSWRYRTSPPSVDWYRTDYDDSHWNQGSGPFGPKGATRWDTDSLWLRSRFELSSSTLPRNPHLVCLHDEDIRVYINGVLVAHHPGFTKGYARLRIPGDSFTSGINVIAVNCVQTIGGQALDTGLIDLPAPPTQPAGGVTIRADFSVSSTPSLSKTKFNVYNCPYFTMDRWERDIHLLEELRCDSLRYDPTWGGHGVKIDWNSPQISGSADNPVYNFTDFDHFTDSLLKRSMKPMYVLAYTPQPLQRSHNDWASPPKDLKSWQRVCRDYAKHWRESGRKVSFYEIWNEPDNPPFFFKGTMGDYFEIYRHGVRGVKEGDPAALVGGPAVAALKHDDSWLCAFLDFVSSESLPLDFLSFHNYGDPFPIIEKARACLARHPELSDVELMLTEYNSYEPLTPAFSEGGASELHMAAPKLLHDFRRLLEEADVTRVYWAMFNDPSTQERCGLVSQDGHRKASYNAFKLYADMPENRISASSSLPEVEVMASRGDNEAVVLMWNMSDRVQNLSVELEAVPFESNLYCTRIDRHHASYYDDPRSEGLTRELVSAVTATPVRWSGALPVGGVIALTLMRPIP